MKEEEKIQYWIESSDKDFDAMEHMYEAKDYTWALFVGHLVLEKLLKGYCLKVLEEQPPYIHNLSRLVEKTGLILTQEQQRDFITITSFNIQGRYDDYKQKFHAVCTKEFTENWIHKIRIYREWIKEKL